MIASKITSRDFIEIPETEVPVPKGYREGVPSKTKIVTPVKQTRKQVSEVDDQGVGKKATATGNVCKGDQTVNI